MSLSINWSTKVITVPQAYLTYITGIFYELDVNQFRLDLKDIEGSDEGITFLDTHRHNTEVTVAGITLARVIEIINGYTITFEDGQYVVTLTGANNNILDVTNANQVSVQSTNSAGLIVSGSGVTQQDKVDIANEVWDLDERGNKIDDIFEKSTDSLQILKGKWEIDTETCRLYYYDYGDSVPLMAFQLLDKDNQPSIKNVVKRMPIL